MRDDQRLAAAAAAPQSDAALPCSPASRDGLIDSRAQRTIARSRDHPCNSSTGDPRTSLGLSRGQAVAALWPVASRLPCLCSVRSTIQRFATAPSPFPLLVASLLLVDPTSLSPRPAVKLRRTLVVLAITTASLLPALLCLPPLFPFSLPFPSTLSPRRVTSFRLHIFLPRPPPLFSFFLPPPGSSMLCRSDRRAVTYTLPASPASQHSSHLGPAT